MVTTNVKSLWDLAFKVSFDELVYKATPETAQLIHDRIDQQLVGRVKKTVREKYVTELSRIFDLKFVAPQYFFAPELLYGHLDGDDKNFTAESIQQLTSTYKNYTNDNGEKDILREFAPLDCSLGEYFTEITINTPNPAFDSFPKLLSIIARRSPKLKKILIRFHYCFYELVNIPPSVAMITTPSCQSSPFECLTHLELSYETTAFDGNPFTDVQSQNSILSLIGKHCPVLTKLSVKMGFCQQKKHLLGLILHEKVIDTLFSTDDDRWSQDSVLVVLQVPTTFLNPLCSTLQELDLHSDFSPFSPSQYRSTSSAYAFTLRHLPKLRKLQIQDHLVIEIIKIIHKVKEMKIPHHQMEFEEVLRDAVAASQIGIGYTKDSITSTTPFTDFPFIEDLDAWIPISVADSVRAVGSLCPHLKMAKFSTNGKKISPKELKSLLSGWSSELEIIKLWAVKPKFLKPLLVAFGASLTSLHFDCCEKIDLSPLAFCNKLEKLSFTGYSTINQEVTDTGSYWTSDTFLPLLSTVRAQSCCLGVWAPLVVERKSRLTNLSLKCLHIGTDAHNPRLEWTQLPELWPNLDFLCIDLCTGLTMTILSEIIPQLHKLRDIRLPNSILSQDPEFTEKITQEFANRKDPVIISDGAISEIFSSCVCLYQLP